jgi:hypothetical protein
MLQSKQASRITHENYYLIRDGMSMAEVQAILGPPVDDSTGPVRFVSGEYTSASSQPAASSTLWKVDDLVVCIEFHAAGGVGNRYFRDSVRRPQNPLDNLLWRAKRQWRRWFPE